MADYFITGVWFDEEKTITHVMLHQAKQDGSSWHHGKKTTVADVVLLIDAGYNVQTKIWSYQQAEWKTGASVIAVNENRIRSLKVAPDARRSEGLHCLIRMKAIADPDAR